MEGFHYELGAMIDTESTSWDFRHLAFVDGQGNYTKHARYAGFIYHDLVNSCGKKRYKFNMNFIISRLGILLEFPQELHVH